MNENKDNINGENTPQNSETELNTANLSQSNMPEYGAKENVSQNLESPMNNASSSQPNVLNTGEVNNISQAEPNIQENKISSLGVLGEEKKKSKKSKKIILILLLVIALIAALAIFFLNRPKMLFLTVVNNSYNELKKDYEDLKENDLYDMADKKSVEVNGNFGLKINTKDPNYRTTAELLNNINISYNFGIDYDKKNAIYDLDISSSKISILKSSLYLMNGNSYVKLHDIFDKYIKVNMGKSYDEAFEIKMGKDLDYVIETVKSTILKELKDGDFKKQTEEIVINKETYKTTKIILTLTKTRMNEIKNNVLVKLIENKKFVSAYANIMGTAEKDVTNDLNRGKQEKIDIEKMNIETFVKNKKALQYNITIKEDVETSIIISDTNDYKDITIKENGIITCSMTQDKNDISINLSEVVIDVQKVDDQNYDFTINFGLDKMSGNIKIVDKEISEIETQKNTIITLNVDSLTNITLNNNVLFKKGNGLSLPQISASVGAEELNENDFNMIMAKLLENPEIIKIMSTIIGEELLS